MFVIIVEGILVLVLTALVQPELVRLGSTSTGNESVTARHSAVAVAAPSSAGRDMRIRFVVSRRTRVALGIFEPNGRQVRRLSNTETAAGPHTVTWDGRDDQGRRVEPGVYYYRLSAANGGERSTLLVVDH
jgi:flagellar hook assembly protein FlgD